MTTTARQRLLYLGLGICEIPIWILGSPLHPWFFGPGLALVLTSLVLFLRDPNPDAFASALSPLYRPAFFRGCLLFTALSWAAFVTVRYLSHGYHFWDTGFFGHEMGRYVLEGRFYSTVLERHALADHFCPNLLLLAPFFQLKITILWLVLFKVLAFLACPFLLLRIGREMLGENHPKAYIAPVLWLFHALLVVNLEAEFQPSSLSPPFILLAFLLALRRKHTAMMLTLIFLVGFKENLPLVWISVGLFLITYRGEGRRGIALILLGIAIGLSIFFLVMPAFNLGQPTAQALKWGPLALLPAKLTLVGMALLSVGLMPLFSPRSLPMILSAFAVALISNVPEMTTFYFHYQDVPLTVLFVGVICGIRDVEEGTSWICRLPSRSRVYAAACVFFLLVVTNTSAPAQAIRRDWPTDRDRAVQQEIETLGRLTRDGCRLWSVETIGVRFLDHPGLAIMDEWRNTWAAPLQDPECHWIVLTREPATSSLAAARYHTMKAGIGEGLKNGRYGKVSEFTYLDVYRTLR